MTLRSFLRRAALTAAASILPLAATPVSTIPYPNPGTVAPTQTFTADSNGYLTAYFYDSTAMFNEALGVFVNGVQQNGWGLENHNSTPGQAYNFGYVTAGDSLVFALNVFDTGDVFYSDSSLNSDEINHTYATPYAGGALPAGTFVGFEDSPYEISDLNYNDETFVYNIQRYAVPEPEALLLMSIGLTAIGLLGASKQK